jgi:UDP-N-acetyl-D-mannosaminuronic acid dehydrogenase
LTVQERPSREREGHSGSGPLDVVVVGGGGHVGLPLSLVLADSGLRVGIYDIAEETLADLLADADQPAAG